MKNKLFTTINTARLGIDNGYALVQSTIELALVQSAILDPLTQQALDYMQACNEELETQLKNTRTEELTKQVRLLNKESDALFASVLRNVKYFLKEGTAAQRLAAEQLTAFLKPYRSLPRKALNTQAALLAEMMGKYLASVELAKAVDALGIKDRMESLKTVNESLIATYQQRNQRAASRPRSNSQLSREALAAYRRFCLLLEQGCLYTGNQWMWQLIGELNGFRSKYHALIARNATAQDKEPELQLPSADSPASASPAMPSSVAIEAAA